MEAEILEHGETERAAEKPDAGGKTPEISEAPAVEELRAEMHADVLSAQLSDFLTQTLQRYLEILGLTEFMDGVNFREIFAEALKELATAGDPLSLQEHPQFHKILKKCVKVCIDRMIGNCKSGNFFAALQYLILAFESARTNGLGIYFTIAPYFRTISAHVSGDRFEKFFAKAAALIPVPAEHFNTNIYPLYYKNFLALEGFNLKFIEECDIATLGRYARQAMEADDSASGILFQRQIVKSDPNSITANIFLATALRRIGGIQAIEEEIKVREKLLILTGKDPEKHNENRDRLLIAQRILRRELNLKYVDLPRRYTGLLDLVNRGEETVLRRCYVLDFIQYSRQAQAASDWVACIFFQQEILKHQPASICALNILIMALEQAAEPGMIQEAQRIRQRISKLRKSATDTLRNIQESSPKPPEPPPPPAPEPAPIPEETGSNIDYSRFDRFVDSIICEATAKWPLKQQVGYVYSIPQADKEGMVASMTAFERQLDGREIIPRRANGPFWKSFETIRGHIVLGEINVRALEVLISRIPEHIDWNK